MMRGSKHVPVAIEAPPDGNLRRGGAASPSAFQQAVTAARTSRALLMVVGVVVAALFCAATRDPEPHQWSPGSPRAQMILQRVDDFEQLIGQLASRRRCRSPVAVVALRVRSRHVEGPRRRPLPLAASCDAKRIQTGERRARSIWCARSGRCHEVTGKRWMGVQNHYCPVKWKC